jgi:hypothetical protein
MSTSPAGPEPAQYQHPTTATAPSADAQRRTLVKLLIFATATIFVGLFAVLYFRWAGAQEPSSAIVVTTTPAFDGTEIVIEGIALPEPYRVTVGSRPGSSIPFYLDRGSYTLRIVSGDRTIYSADFSLEANRLLQIDLGKFEHLLPPTTAPAAAGAATAITI